MKTPATDTTPRPLLVTGRSGTLGRQVVARLRAAGQPVRVLSRRPAGFPEGVQLAPGDLATNEGVDAALAGVGVVIHCAGSAKGDDLKARTLVHAAKRARIRHIYISVVGADATPIDGPIDRAMFGYFGAKHTAGA